MTDKQKTSDLYFIVQHIVPWTNLGITTERGGQPQRLKSEPAPHMVGFCPAFDDKAAAMAWRDAHAPNCDVIPAWKVKAWEAPAGEA